MFSRISLLFAFFAVASAAVCPDNGILWNRNCYVFNSTLTGYARAELNCQQQGGHLVAIHNTFDNAIIAESAPDYFHESGVTNFWIGLNSLSNPNWQWTDQSNVDFTNWAKGQPKNGSGLSCAVLQMNAQTWAAEKCTVLKPFVCIIPTALGQTTPPPPPPTTPGAPVTWTPPNSRTSCSDGWDFYPPTNSYFCGGIVAPDWQSGEDYCVSVGGHLTSIHNDDEAMFIDGYWFYLGSQDYPFIGLHSLDNGTSWVWTDGSPTDYLNWDINQPFGGNCVFLGDDNGHSQPPKFVQLPCSGDLDEAFTVCKKSS